jgi:hypothetical protein
LLFLISIIFVFSLISNQTAKDVQKPKYQSQKSKPEKDLMACPEKSPLLLGPLRVIEDFAESDPGSKEFRKWFGEHLQMGGTYRPPDCIAKQKVAVIVPYR